MNYIRKSILFIIRFLKEVKIEMKRVNWLSRKEVTNYTILVIAVSVTVGIYLGSLDFLFQWLLSAFVL